MGQGQLIPPRRRFLLRTLAVAEAGIAAAVCGAAVCGAAVCGAFGRRVWAQAVGLRFRPLAQPVLIALTELATPWRARSFVANGVTLSSAATPNQPIRVSGMVVRTSAGSTPDSFAAVCVRCPHEGCDVEFMSDPARLPQEVKDEIGRPIEHAIYLCPCHNSTFKPEDGTPLSGPAPRGLYRFRVTNVSAAAVEIADVEEDVLIFL